MVSAWHEPRNSDPVRRHGAAERADRPRLARAAAAPRADPARRRRTSGRGRSTSSSHERSMPTCSTPTTWSKRGTWRVANGRRGSACSRARCSRRFLRRRRYRRIVAFADRIGLELALLFKLTRSRRDLVLVSNWLMRARKARVPPAPTGPVAPRSRSSATAASSSTWLPSATACSASSCTSSSSPSTSGSGTAGRRDRGADLLGRLRLRLPRLPDTRRSGPRPAGPGRARGRQPDPRPGAAAPPRRADPGCDAAAGVLPPNVDYRLGGSAPRACASCTRARASSSCRSRTSTSTPA